MGRKFGTLGKRFGTWGRETWEEAIEEERDRRREAGRKGAADAFANYDEEDIEEQRQAGRDEWNNMSEADRATWVENGRNWWKGLSDVEQHGFVEARREAWMQLSSVVQERIKENLGMHAEVARTIRTAEAEARYEEDGDPDIVPDGSMWDCIGCNLECAKEVTLLSFSGVSNVKMLRWLLSHKLLLPI